jgi:hypothetical protein
MKGSARDRMKGRRPDRPAKPDSRRAAALRSCEAITTRRPRSRKALGRGPWATTPPPSAGALAHLSTPWSKTGRVGARRERRETDHVPGYVPHSVDTVTRDHGAVIGSPDHRSGPRDHPLSKLWHGRVQKNLVVLHSGLARRLAQASQAEGGPGIGGRPQFAPGGKCSGCNLNPGRPIPGTSCHVHLLW